MNKYKKKIIWTKDKLGHFWLNCRLWHQNLELLPVISDGELCEVFKTLFCPGSKCSYEYQQLAFSTECSVHFMMLRSKFKMDIWYKNNSLIETWCFRFHSKYHLVLHSYGNKKVDLFSSHFFKYSFDIDNDLFSASSNYVHNTVRVWQACHWLLTV